MSGAIERIKKYFNGSSRYPLFVVVSPDEYRAVLEEFSSFKKIRVSDYCSGADKEPDIGKLEEDVGRFRGNCLLLGLGDYLAGRGSAKAILYPYKSLHLQARSHVVLLLSARMHPVVKEILREDARMASRVVFPEENPQGSEPADSKIVHGIRGYLEACEKGVTVGIVKTVLNIANVTVIDPENAFDELKHRFPYEFAKLAPSNGTGEYWKQLLAEVDERKKTVLQYLASQQFVPLEHIFLEHAKKKDYDSWLYFIWLKLRSDPQSYLGFVANKTDSPDDLFGRAKTAILEVDVPDSRFSLFYQQRKALLKGSSDADMASFIQHIYQRDADRIAYLTDNTKLEKKEIVVALGEGAKADNLKDSYPALFDYLQDYRFSDDSLTAYFSSYKKSKVYNEIDESLMETVRRNAASRPYNTLPSRSSVFSGMETDKTLLIFLDAMGVEFLGYVKESCAKLGLRFSVKIARANLPTITPLNTDFYDEWQGTKETIKDIDELKHKPERGYDFYNSKFPVHLPEELEVVREALERAKIRLKGGEFERVIIASDHGASRLAVIGADQQIDCGDCESKSSGRYCQGVLSQVPDNVAVEGEYAVVADYSRFKGARMASVEVHGGATLEEVVVPIIELTLADREIHVSLEKSLIEISYRKVPELVLIVTPDCDEVTGTVNNVEYKAEKLNRSRFRVVLLDLKKGKYTMKVFESQNPIGSVDFTIQSKGIVEKDLF